MNSKTLGILSSIALAAMATPASVYAQHGARGGGHGSIGGGAKMGATASRPSGGGQFAGRGGNSNHTRGNWNHSGVNRNHHGDGNWNHHGGNWRHHHWPRSYYYYGGFGYPFYGFGYPYYGFGYPYGYGYGYPYYGASATFYSDGNRRYSQNASQPGNGSVVTRVQQRLARAGYYHGAIDGVIGNGTRSAIRAYERANRLPVDGRIDSDLLGRMGLS